MSVEIACTCDGLPAHSHVFRASVDPSPRKGETKIFYVTDPYDVRIWVDWKEVARCLSQQS